MAFRTSFFASTMNAAEQGKKGGEFIYSVERKRDVLP